MANDGIPGDKITITLTRRQWVMICWVLLPHKWRRVYRDGFFTNDEVGRAALSLERQIPDIKQ